MDTQTNIQNSNLEKSNIEEIDIHFSFFGKLMEKNGNYFIILSDKYEQIIFLYDNGNIKKNYEINKFYNFSEMNVREINEDSLFLETIQLSKIIELDNYDETMKNKINEKILIKYNFIDYKIKDNLYNYIILYKSQENVNIDINNNTIYYVYKDENSVEYFPQKIGIYKNHTTNILTFKILILKGYCNEINIFINIEGGFAYEYYYLSEDKEFLPKSIEINLNNTQKYASSIFWQFETIKRQKITFVNIPNQETTLNLLGYNSFLQIVSCSSKKIENYGPFVLDNLEIEKNEEVKINYSFKNLIINIQKDIDSFINDKVNYEFLEKKYLSDEEKYKDELSEDYRGFSFPNNIETFYYFNNMCIWNILSKANKKYLKIILKRYIKNFEVIQKKETLYYQEKITLLITFTRRILNKNNKDLIIPRIIFFDEINQLDLCYKEAYDFHLKLIDSLNENSMLIKPFLQLNSYIMDKILTNEEKNYIKEAKKHKIANFSEKDKINQLIKKNDNEDKNIQSGYTISMISIDVIKKHLKSTMKPYALVLPKGNNNDFAASVYKDNYIITFNEEEIFKAIDINNLNDIDYMELRKKDFAFIINMYYLHENSSHNKEKIINYKKESPIIFLDEDLKEGIILSDIYCNSGEAGYFTENFIAKRAIILNLLDCTNSFQDLLKIEYFTDKNFDNLIVEYNSKIKDKKEETKENLEEKNSYYSIIIKNKKNKTKYDYDNVKRDMFGLTARDNYLSLQAKEEKCNY